MEKMYHLHSGKTTSSVASTVYATACRRDSWFCRWC